MKKMNLLKSKLMLLMSLFFVGTTFAVPKFDGVEVIQNFVSPQQAIEIIITENTKLQEQMVELIQADELDLAKEVRLKSAVYSGVMQAIQNVNNVESALTMYFGSTAVVTPSNRILERLTPAQLNAFRAEITDKLRS
jgi:hypothetical protein